MDTWAQAYFGRATFVCVGCDGPELATAFAKRLRLSKCLLTYVDEANGPRWGQLGCSGFIVLDAQGKVACRATKAFLEVRELAFAHVEALLGSLLAGSGPPSIVPGQHVELFGLTRADLNGTRGYVVKEAAARDGRWVIETYFGKQMSVRAENMRMIDNDCEDGEDEDEEAAGFVDTSSE